MFRMTLHAARPSRDMARTLPLFDERDADDVARDDAAGARRLPLLGEQKDIRYLASRARSVLNGPETTGMTFWSVNPYVGCAFGCAYCYARYAHRYAWERATATPARVAEAGAGVGDARDADAYDAEAAMPAWLAFERRVLVKEDAPALLRDAMRRLRARGGARWRSLREHGIAIGTATDPYQPAERRFRVTRGLLEVLASEGAVPVGLITKSPLVTRDVDLLAAIARRARLTVHVTITTLDRELARRLEPRAPTPEARLRAVRRLREAGLDVGVNVMPVLPGITDSPAMLDALVRAIADAGATHLGACALRLRRTARERYLPFVAEEFPALADRYRRAYAHGHQPSARYRDGLRAFVAAACERHGVHCGYPPDPPTDAERDPDDVTRDPRDAGARARLSQLTLAL
jgi:DNA repair photolyase